MRVLRFDDWTRPVPPATREVLSAPSDGDGPPVLFVTGGGAQVFAEHWLGHTAGRGFPAYALTPRVKGDLRAHVHDLVQTAAGLPRQTVLVGHGRGALVVAHALERYPARAVALVAPVVDTFVDRLLKRVRLPRPVGDPPVLVAGSPDDKVVARTSLDRVAARYGGAPLLFPGMGHDLMREPNRAEPIDAICDWLGKELS